MLETRSNLQVYLEDESTELEGYADPVDDARYQGPDWEYLSWYESFTKPLPVEGYYELQLDQNEEYCWANRPVYFTKGTQYA